MSTRGDDTSQPSRLLSLPSELRDIIYEHLFEPSGLHCPFPGKDGYFHYDFSSYLALQRTCRLIAYESKPIFHSLNRFARISTPWPEAQHHIENEGRVPMVCAGGKALNFKCWSVDAVIDAPQLRGMGVGANEEDDFSFCKFILHVRDLDGFSRMWYYSDLSHPGLNGHLRLTIVLRDPFRTIDDETGEEKGRLMSKQLQTEIMIPFGRVKGLHSVEVDGQHDNSIFRAMKAEMDTPYMTAEECLDRATKKKEEADAAILKKDHSRAIELFWQAFEEMHIPCEGRRRNIYGDAWFVRTLESGRYEGQQGHLVRLVLRVQLVASVVDCYLGLEQWEEAKFWGMRSINLMREANGDEDGEADDEPMLGFPGADAVGLLYFRTAKALRLLGEKTEARKLIKVAVAYLPRDEEVRKEYQELKPRMVGGYGWI